MGNGDNFALDWIRGELESTLDQARAALESYAEGGREETRLRSCLTSLHQVHGTLRMLELEGVVLLADHMEQTAQSLLNGSIQDSKLAEATLMQSILQLPAFIEEVQGGVVEDLPLVMPYVNELRGCCGLSPMQLTPPVSADFSSEQAAEAMRRFKGINGVDKATRVRAAYQQVLLSVLKGGASGQTVETLRKIAIGMQRICEGAPLTTLWKALEHFANGYASDPQKMSSEAIRDLRRVDAEMKKVVTSGAEALVEPLPVELVRDLLRAAEARGERDDEITELRSSVQLPQAPQVKPREALDQAAGVLAEEIAVVRDRFDLFTRNSQRSVAELVELTGPLDTISSTLSILGDDHGADALRVQRAHVLALDSDGDISDDLVLNLASVLVQTEQGLSGFGEISSGDDDLASAALNEAQMAVLQEARGGIDHVKQSIVDFVSSKWNTGYLEDSPSTLAAVQGALTMIPLPRASSLLSQCGDYISAQLLAGHRPDWQELDAFADALGGIDYFLERLFETGRAPGDEALDLTEESLQRLSGEKAGETAEESAVAADAATESEDDSADAADGGDTALTAMLGARPEDLAFAASDDEVAEPTDLEQAEPLDLVVDDSALEVPLDDLEAVDDSSSGEFDLIALDEDEQEDRQADDLQITDDAHDQQAGDAAELVAETAHESAAEEQVSLTESVDDSSLDSPDNTDTPIDSEQTAFVDSSFDESGNDSAAGMLGGAIGAAGALGAVGSALSVSGDEVASDAAVESSAAAESREIPEPQADESEAKESAPAPEPVDPEIVEIFVEEVDEVLASVEAQLPEWSVNLSAEGPLGEIRRSFHTLKGSGRIVGANHIGELGWALENMINRLLEGTISASEDHLFLVSNACRVVPQLRADFAEGNQIERPELIELLEQADVLASGGTLTKTLADSAASAIPVMDEAGDLQEEDFPIWDDGSDSGDEALEARPPSVDVPSFFDTAADVPELSANDPVELTDTRQLFAEEVREHMEVLEARVRDSQGEEDLQLDSGLTRALHTIAGSAATAGEAQVVGVAEPLQDVCSAVLRERNGVLDGEYLAFVREGVYALQRLLDVDAPANIAVDVETDDESGMFAAEADRLLGGLLEAPDASTSLLAMPDTTLLLDAREFLDGWRFGSLDLARAEQMARALTNVTERAHSAEMAELARLLLKAHEQFADEPLDEERHIALVGAHDDLLVQLDALAAGQVSVPSADAVDRLEDVLHQGYGQAAEPEARQLEVVKSEDTQALVEEEALAEEPTEELDDDAQEALAYELDESDAFDLGALDDDIFAPDEPAADAAMDLTADDFIAQPVEPEFEPEPQAEPESFVAPQPFMAPESGASVERETDFARHDEDDEVDHELLEIFFEEADEILENFDHDLQGWSGDRSSGVHLENLLRGLHTLKGGARLAGQGQLGDMTHDYESELIGLQEDPAAVDDEQFAAVQSRYDDLVEAVGRARNNEPVLLTPEPVSATEPAEAEPVVADESDELGAPESAVAALPGQETADVDEVSQQAELTEHAADSEYAEEPVPAADAEPETTDAAEEAADTTTAFVGVEVDELDAIQIPDDANSLELPTLTTTVAAGMAVSAGAALRPDAGSGDAGKQHPPAIQSREPATPETQDEDRSRSSQEMVRVSAALLEDLVNVAGESSIVRARVEQGINDFGAALEEMETTIERVREQLRRLELETETRVLSREERSVGPAYEEFDPLEMDRYSQLQQLTRSLTESATDMMDLKETLRYRARESETLLLQQARLNTELQEGLMRTRMVPFSRLMPRLRRIVRQVSRDLNKQVEFEAYNAEGELDRNVLERMVPPLEHMLRNSIDHGIEPEDLRHSFGKPSIGHINLKLSREGGDVVIEISDDGAGIDVETVRAKAIERELMAPDAVLTDDQVLDFVLAPGFSTAKSLTQISGRGVGMDVVHSEVKQLGGSISISSVPGRGTTFTVRLPFTVSVNRALMVSLGDDQYAIPLNTIEGIVLLQGDDLSRHYGPQGVPFEYAGVPYRVRYLGSYLGREYVARGDQSTVPVVLVRSGDQAVAVHVDDVQGSREIVVKSLGPQFAGVGGISGATILGDGSVVIILDLLSLMRTRGPGINSVQRAPSNVEEERWVLVVDDSVTVRKVTSRLLERQGMNVITAKDGVEAVSVLQERLPDIVLLDIEMPRMDGFEVARQVRRDERLADLPIVMISSRTGEKHTERARELGVNRFLGKPFQENELLEVIDELVKRS